MKHRILHLSVLFGVLNPFSNAQVCSVNGVCEPETPETFQNLINWVVEKGGYVHPNLEIRQTYVSFGNQEEESSSSDDEEEYFDLSWRVKGPIPKGESLFTIPRSTVILCKVFGEFLRHDVRLLAETVGKERTLHKVNRTSQYGPYIDFLEEYAVNQARIPATWSEAGQALIQEIMDDSNFASLDEYVYADPSDHNIEEDETWVQNMELSLSRRREMTLPPIYDIITHSNSPEKINVAVVNGQNVSGVTEVLEDFTKLISNEGFTVEAIKDLKEGDQLYHSYGDSKRHYNQDFGFVDYGLGTMELLRDYGIVESYPQRWHFGVHNVDIRVYEGDDGRLSLDWIWPTIPDDDALYYFNVYLENMKGVQEELAKTDIWAAASRYELWTAGYFLECYITALELLIKEATKHRGPDESEYLVQEEKMVIDNLDNDYFQIYQCNTLLVANDQNHYDSLELVQSAYQKIDYFFNEQTMDTCLFLDNVYQQCRSYWPHYHELVVHKPIKYLKEPVKRVLWVGGGDSGVLNEFLKYPTLELAVGLELDQQVTRLAFKHFGSRPHFDDPRVQWWYGDASKSILMLPKDYFGTFDVVVVDLSDTVFSLSVSSELDVIEAISLLLRPGGVFEMNELFLKKVSNVFEYALHYQFTDVPKICDQAAIFASNDIDFLNTPLTEHSLVEDAMLLVEKDSMKSKHQFDRVHDYRRNPNPKFKRLCKKTDEERAKVKPQEQAPGIVLIVEAQNLTADLNSADSIRKTIIDNLEALGLHDISDADAPISSSRFIIMLREGFLVVRLFPMEKYCSLDIHLWSAFDKHEAVREAIVVNAFGGDMLNKSTASFRIVAGGMFGLPTWKEDAAMHGPDISKVCPADSGPLRDSASDEKIFEQAVELGLNVAQGEDLVVAVLCGTVGEFCSTIAVVEAHERVKQVIPLHACYIPSDDKRFDDEECIRAKSAALLDQILPGDDDLINVIIFDKSAPAATIEAVDVLFAYEHIDINNLIMLATTDTRNEVWRRRFVDNVRTQVETDPVSRALLLLNTTSSSLELSIGISGDELFFEHLTKAVASSEENNDNGVVIEIRNIIGGKWRETKKHVAEDSEFSHVTVDADYDNTEAQKQWKSQVPLANQTVSQFTNCEIGSYDMKTFSCDLLEVKKEELLQACKHAFSTVAEGAMQFYDEIGGDGLACAGLWKTGTAVISWDGRYQIDFNIWTMGRMGELASFQSALLVKLPNLVHKLRDVQPRGPGGVVNFKFDLSANADDHKFVNWAGLPIVSKKQESFYLKKKSE